MIKFLFGLLVSCFILLAFASGYSDDDAWADYKVITNNYFIKSIRLFIAHNIS